MNFDPKKIEQTAVELTRQISVVDSKDEVAMVEHMHGMMTGYDYFKKNPEHLWMVASQGDALGRKSVLAMVKGKGGSKKTVVLLGHTDTVGISDYGILEPLATQPYELTEKLKELKEMLTPQARADLESGNWLFGRGLFDMKAGDAVHMAIIEEVGKIADQFDGNLIFAGVCDEESGSCGMLTVVGELVRLQKEHGFEYQALIDTDYMTNEYDGDENKYIYIGTVGKLLPTCYVVGKETHVGESFKGLDPNQIAGAITSRVNLNPEFCDIVEGEVTLPPITLLQRDGKKEYSVQIATTATVYFNYATHNSTPDQVLAKMVKASQDSFEEVVATLNQRYARFCEMARRPVQPLPWKARAITYEELYQKVKAERGDELDKTLEALMADLYADKAMDPRERSIKIVEKVHSLWSDRDPAVIVFFAPPYYPHNYIEGSRPAEAKLLEAAAQAVKDTPCDYKLVNKKFYPYISDLSFGSAPSDPKILAALKDNLPGFGKTYLLPLDDMQTLNLPVVNIGTFGRDAHKFTERLEKSYSFEVTPQLVYKTIMNLLK